MASMRAPHASLFPCLLATALCAQEAPSLRTSIDRIKETVSGATGGLNLSAFADGSTWYDEAARKRFGFGAAELDLGLRLGERFEVSGAFVGTRDERFWGVYLLDWHPFGGGSVAPRGHIWAEEGFHIQVGRFDVPFGQDWAYFASKDSVSVARPLTTQLITEGGFNDRGMRLLGNNGTVNFNAYALLGSGEGRRYGGRLGFTPFGMPFALKEGREPKTVELGLSAFTRREPGGAEAERAFALDLELRAGAFSLLGEHLGRQYRPAGRAAFWRRGWHLTPQWTFSENAPTAFVRYEKVWGRTPDSEDAEPATRLSAGLAATLWGMWQAKVEVQRSLHTPATLGDDPTYRGSRVLFQVVVVL